MPRHRPTLLLARRKKENAPVLADWGTPLALVEAQSGDEMMLGFKSDLDFADESARGGRESSYDFVMRFMARRAPQPQPAHAHQILTIRRSLSYCCFLSINGRGRGISFRCTPFSPWGHRFRLHQISDLLGTIILALHLYVFLAFSRQHRHA
jgi:hypothetical protein